MLENIDLLARRVEMNLDWASNTDRDSANAGGVGAVPMSRIKLGGYNFDCDSEENMPNFKKAYIDLKARNDTGHIKPNVPNMRIDWYSAKHELLTMYYCFHANHVGLKVPLEWAAASTLDPIA